MSTKITSNKSKKVIKNLNKLTMLQKPIQLRIVFILNVILALLPFIFYYVFSSKNISIEGLKPIYFIYTGIGYITSFIVMIYAILSKKIKLFRTVFVATILISLPTKAYIGIAVAAISILLSFHSKIKTYLNS